MRSATDPVEVEMTDELSIGEEEVEDPSLLVVVVVVVVKLFDPGERGCCCCCCKVDWVLVLLLSIAIFPHNSANSASFAKYRSSTAGVSDESLLMIERACQ
jgi:hypothetical protein